MKPLKDLLGKEIKVISQRGDTSITINQLHIDSRKVSHGDAFIAIKGATSDGHTFIDKAISTGAKAIIATEPPPPSLPEGITWLQVADSSLAAGYMAAAWHNHPSKAIKVTGITGTNGKTTVATLLYQLFQRLGYRVGLISTVENRIGDEVEPSTHTTPDALSLQALLAKMRDAGCTHIFMEVSSHAVAQERIAGLHFTGAAFTNLTHDHLDYHGTFANYLKAKKRFFDNLPKSAFAIVNADDKNGKIMLQNTVATTYSFGLKHKATYKTKVIENNLTGLQLLLDGTEVFARMIGDFNASNLTAVYGIALLLGADKYQVLTILSDLRGAEGRFDAIPHPHIAKCVGIIDYAHTPDALEKVLDTILKMKGKSGKIITVVGCGGDRDKTKRPIMAKVAAQRSHQLILTNDNPRTEAPAAILQDMEAGLDANDLKKTLSIENREQAIKTAAMIAREGDIILIAGKGHEKYQDINGTKHPFDDKAILQKCMGLGE